MALADEALLQLVIQRQTGGLAQLVVVGNDAPGIEGPVADDADDGHDGHEAESVGIAPFRRDGGDDEGEGRADDGAQRVAPE